MANPDDPNLISLDLGGGCKVSTFKYLDLEYSPASTPTGCPHVIDMRNVVIEDLLKDGKFPLSYPDIIATTLYHKDPEILKEFLAVDTFDYINFRVHNYDLRKPDGGGHAVKEEKPSIIWVRLFNYVYAAIMLHDQRSMGDRVNIVHDWHKWKITGDPAQPWVLEAYAAQFYSLDWSIYREWHFSGRGHFSKYYKSPSAVMPIPEALVKWKDVPEKSNMLWDKAWEDFGGDGPGKKRRVTVKRDKEREPLCPVLSAGLLG